MELPYDSLSHKRDFEEPRPEVPTCARRHVIYFDGGPRRGVEKWGHLISRGSFSSRRCVEL